MTKHELSAIMITRGRNKVSSLSASKPSQEDFMRIAQKCTVDGCLRTQHGKGYCSPHYIRFKAHGDPNGGTPVPAIADKTCSETNCEKRVFVGGWCNTHWIHNTGRHETVLARQRKKRGEVEYTKSLTYKYEKTPNGFLMRVYRNMVGRVTGLQPKSRHTYMGLSLLPKQQFYDWAKSDDNFWELFKRWEESKYNRKLTPSINRIDPAKGYEIDNIEWLTQSENSSLGAKSSEYSWDRWNKKWVKRRPNL